MKISHIAAVLLVCADGAQVDAREYQLTGTMMSDGAQGFDPLPNGLFKITFDALRSTLTSSGPQEYSENITDVMMFGANGTSYVLGQGEALFTVSTLHGHSSITTVSLSAENTTQYDSVATQSLDLTYSYTKGSSNLQVLDDILSTNSIVQPSEGAIGVSNDAVLTPVPVPTPAPFLVLLTGLGALVGVRRLRRRPAAFDAT